MEQISPLRQKELEELEQKLRAIFLSKNLLNQSLTHSSYGHEQKMPDNERLEFLGDAILKLVVSEYLYHKFPERAEGDLTKIRAGVISDETLAGIGRQLSLGDYLLMSANEKKSGGARRKSNMANTLEALIGAIFLDGGLGKSREMILNFLAAEIDKVSKAGYISDYKSALQEYAQKEKWELPRYSVMKETGPRHRRVFWIEVNVNNCFVGIGKGGNKKEAEQRAAARALSQLKAEERTERKKERKGIKSLISKVRKRIKI